MIDWLIDWLIFLHGVLERLIDWLMDWLHFCGRCGAIGTRREPSRSPPSFTPSAAWSSTKFPWIRAAWNRWRSSYRSIPCWIRMKSQLWSEGTCSRVSVSWMWFWRRSASARRRKAAWTILPSAMRVLAITKRWPAGRELDPHGTECPGCTHTWPYVYAFLAVTATKYSSRTGQCSGTDRAVFWYGQSSVLVRTRQCSDTDKAVFWYGQGSVLVRKGQCSGTERAVFWYGQGSEVWKSMALDVIVWWPLKCF